MTGGVSFLLHVNAYEVTCNENNEMKNNYFVRNLNLECPYYFRILRAIQELFLALTPDFCNSFYWICGLQVSNSYGERSSLVDNHIQNIKKEDNDQSNSFEYWFNRYYCELCKDFTSQWRTCYFHKYHEKYASLVLYL